MGNIRTKTDANGYTTTYEYRLISVTTPNGETSVYTYDPNGNILSQRDPAGNTQHFEYNVRNMLIRRIDDGGRTGSKGKYVYDCTRIESYTYNPSGTLATKVDRNGVTARYSYDVHGRMLSQTAGNTTISYTYDNAGNQLTITDSTGTTARAYDELGRVILKSVPNIGVMTFEYDIAAGVPAGHVKEVTRDVKGNITEREYDKLNRLVKVTSDGETIEYQYYQDGKRKSVIYPGATETYIYYTTGHLQSLENKTSGGAVIDSYSYTYDPAGNQISKTDAKGVTQYEYDSLNRLAKVTEPNGKLTEYTFDKAGNRKTEKVVDGATTTTSTYEYNSQNRLMTVVKESGTGVKDTTKYTYDHNGNMTYQAVETIKAATPGLKPSFGLIIIGQTENEMSRRIAHYVYDTFNRLIQAKTGGTTAQYVYNGEGLRVQKTVNGETTLYLYEYDKVVLELDKNGNQVARNVYGLNLLARQVDGEKYYYMYNGHADVTVLLDAVTGLVAASYYYDAFGNILEESGSVSNPIRYAGYQYDEETELYYLNARMYDPKIARFLQEDTYRGNRNDPLSLHLYAYAVNNPIRYWDPTGRSPVPVRSHEEGQGNTVDWSSGSGVGKSVITVTGNGNTKDLLEGRDFYIALDGKAYYMEVDGKKDTGDINGQNSKNQPNSTKDVNSLLLNNDVEIAPVIVVGMSATVSAAVKYGPLALLDSPAIGPADLVYAGMVIYTGVVEYGPILYDKVVAVVDYVKQAIKNAGQSSNSSGGSSSSTPDPDDWDIGKKITKQMEGRGWTESSIRETVSNPYTTREALNKATGNPATAYYTQDGAYVVVDNVTRAVIQISDALDPLWIPDPTIVNPYLPGLR